MKKALFLAGSLLASAAFAQPQEAPVVGDAPEAGIAPQEAPGAKRILVAEEPDPEMADKLDEAFDQPIDAAPFWTVANAEVLLDYIEAVAAEGLVPADYNPEGLRAAIVAGDMSALATTATDSFNKLSAHLALGQVDHEARVDWHIKDADLSEERQRALLEWALYEGKLKESLDKLLPEHPQYAALKNALAVADPADAEGIAKIRLNLDRWRWLPRDLGDRYIIVNVPAYTAALVENGETISRHRAVAGAVRTPTPQLMAEATGVIFNPYWNVPKSIEPEVRGKAGYEAIRDDDGNIVRYRQPPGPNNSLGRIKFVMYNPHLIYLHDTNARGLFNAEERARSHGCIRTENILGLANMLLKMDGNDWSEEKTLEIVNSGKNTGAKFANSLPVFIAYFTLAARGDGSVIDYEDIYGRDKPVAEALNEWQPSSAEDAQVAEAS
ncbi:L,D-transpeptidase family protein [Sphingomicrobium marinum]|uniref:L,D-transpeptidase family protein n=1 Tax=Sphingomicrobium marinum TaxID=1227950 RepID=UPI00223F12A3|nr:L,D-transpeptidase family protein [Sphingomicrobium marinum]